MGERDGMLVAESYFSEWKLKNDFGAAFRYIYIYASFLVIVMWFFMRFFPFLGIVTWCFHICRYFPYRVIVLVIQKFVVFRFILLLLIKIFRWQPLCYKQSPAFTQKFQQKVSSFLQLRMKNTLFVKTTASAITTKRRVFYLLVNIRLYYLETFKSY